MFYDVLIRPFVEFPFLRHALGAAIALSVGAGPLGVFLVLRRMSLMGDAVSHAILPGAAAGFLVSGLSIGAMSLGGFAAGLIVALLSGWASRLGILREDATLAAFYLISLALGVLLIAERGGSADLVHILFGSLLSVETRTLYVLGLVAILSLLGLMTIYRPLLLESFDPGFLRAVGGKGSFAHMAFLALVVLNLVAGMQALGTLLSIGLMMLPAAASRLWTQSVGTMMVLATAIAGLCSLFGLIVSYHFDVPSGPALVLCAGAIYVFSLFFGRRGGVILRLLPRPHLEH